ncbi:LamG-like jellyroll fold domain-containing protein, partial [Sphaerisporangium sp. NPDC051017]|uniref:LamG-like jellyroll fold domain-containing protein n=1 Tax=Sphaerisporangium sp. NPDC051017 TaxID=3154636 RepID=UPI00341E83ED
SWAKKEWDLVHSVNGIVQAWADGQPNYGFQLTAGNESDLTNWRRYRTTEYTVCNNGTACEKHPHQPLLFVDFEPAPEPIEALYVRPRGSSAPTLDEVLAHVNDSVEYEPADPATVTPAQLETDAEQSTAAVGSLLKDAALPDGMALEEIERWSNPDIGEDPMQPPTPKAAAAHWLFDEAVGTKVADSTLRDNQATLNTGTRWIPGKAGTALSNAPAVIDVPDSPSGPSVSTLQAIPSAQVGGKTITSSVTPRLQAQVNDPAGGTLRADFEIEHDPAAPEGQGTGQIWASDAQNVTAGTTATVTVPAGKLADGWLVRWRARAVSATATSPWSDWQLLTVDPANAGNEPLTTVATPIIRTDESFAIAAWVRLDDRDGRYAIAEQKGISTAPFHLGVDPAHGLVFTMRQSDSAASSEEGAVSETVPPVGEWFHLAGSYDASSGTLSLY